MKKVIICAVLLSCILCACSAQQDSPTAKPDSPASKQDPSEPPDLMINIDGDETDEITATMGTYSWYYRGKGTEADSPHPLDMRDMVTIADNPEKIKLVFYDDPAGYSVRRWVKGAGYEDFDTVETEDDRIVPIEDDTIYIYEIKAEYKNGTVYYAFQICK